MIAAAILPVQYLIAKIIIIPGRMSSKVFSSPEIIVESEAYFSTENSRNGYALCRSDIPDSGTNGTVCRLKRYELSLLSLLCGNIGMCSLPIFSYFPFCSVSKARYAYGNHTLISVFLCSAYDRTCIEQDTASEYENSKA
ncbi:MAG: hypothetical protein IJI61_05660 [Oscillospiraceae bacterium]|nr:hypothetical protein [Oscillospiraceae bacterium]